MHELELAFDNRSRDLEESPDTVILSVMLD
jgi:hypothetical protein